MKQFTGTIIDKKMAKTARVLVNRIKVHPLYKKRIKVRKIYHVHDELDTKIGDVVNFQDCKPISKTKKWRIVKVVKKAGKRTINLVKTSSVDKVKKVSKKKKNSKKIKKNNK